jgi:GMP synthase (glutamine-hydrolysing)
MVEAPASRSSDAAPDARVLVLDFGSQYTQLIARRVRELGVYCEIYPWHCDEGMLREFNPQAVILSGGPASVADSKAPRMAAAVMQLQVPTLGICYGMQLMAQELGGAVDIAERGEYGGASVRLKACPLFADLKQLQLDVWMSHGDAVRSMPTGFESIGESDNAPIAAMGDISRHWYGLQFHPEVRHTEEGVSILSNFLHGIAKCGRDWTPGSVRKQLLEKIRAQVGKQSVLLGLSGGVDSSVAAALLHEAIGTQLTCVFIDNGLLRQGEADQVRRDLGEALGLHIVSVDATERFLKALRKVSDPERKRRVIGRVFVEEFQKQALRLGKITFLAQGTIYSDVIESAGGSDTAHVIKSHHNVGGLPKRMKMRLVEPLRDLFKDEVRRLGKEMAIPESLINRHPFPGPGLGVRILGEVNRQAADTLRAADHVFMEELQASGWYHKLSQAFAVYLPVSSVGVAGDARVYAPVIALRAVQTDDFMTARWARLPDDLLSKVSARIVNEVPGISRVVYDISDKPPATIEWE